MLVLANATLEVAEACSGIRSLVSLFTLGLVFGYFVDRRIWVRAIIALSAIPVAILANGLRVAAPMCKRTATGLLRLPWANVMNDTIDRLTRSAMS